MAAALRPHKQPSDAPDMENPETVDPQGLLAGLRTDETKPPYARFRTCRFPRLAGSWAAVHEPTGQEAVDWAASAFPRQQG
eukprot:6051565-Pyramimonas_sp.AAC.1